jgi:hypothetical protein
MVRRLAFYLIVGFLFVISKADTLVLQDSPEEVIKSSIAAFEKGDAVSLTNNFFSTVEIDLLGEENFYSKAQAQLLLKSFFEKNSPVKFTINHKGVKELTAFAIGVLQCKSNSYRVSMFMKTEKEKSRIHQLRIEPESEI